MRADGSRSTRSPWSASRSWHGAVLTRRLPDGVRRAARWPRPSFSRVRLVRSLVRTGGLERRSRRTHRRWTKTPEERLPGPSRRRADAAAPPDRSRRLPRRRPRRSRACSRSGGAHRGGPARAGARAPRRAPPVERPAIEARAEWPASADPIGTGSSTACASRPDWSASPPVEMAAARSTDRAGRQFAVRGDLVYTQEQRGDDEVVACYRKPPASPVWRHRDAARFWESNAGAGPRATPALRGDRVYRSARPACSERARLPHGRGPVVAQRRGRQKRRIAGLGLLGLAARGGRRRDRGHRRCAQARPTTPAPAEPRWVGANGGYRLQLAAAWSRSGASGRSLLLSGAGAASAFCRPTASRCGPSRCRRTRAHRPARGHRRRRRAAPRRRRERDAPCRRRHSGPEGWTAKERWASRA